MNNSVVFTNDGPKECIFKEKLCNYCEIYYECDSYTIDNKKFLYNPNENIDLIVTSKESVFEISLLKEYDKQLVRNATTFSGFSDVYNDGKELIHGRNGCLSDEAYFDFGSERIHVGCDETPERGSYFCKKHYTKEANIDSVEFDEE